MKGIVSNTVSDVKKVHFLRIIHTPWKIIFCKIIKTILRRFYRKSWCIFIYLNRFIRSFRFCFSKPDGVLVIETGVLGDCMLGIAAYKALFDYCQKTNRNFLIVCSEFIEKILTEYCGIEKKYFVCFKNRAKTSKRDFKKLVKQIGGKKYEYVIRRDSHPFSSKIAYSLFAKHGIYYSYDVCNQNFFERVKARCCFNDIRHIRDDVFVSSVWREILHSVGLSDYRSKIGKLHIPQSKIDLCRQIIPAEKYVLIAPEASEADRTLDISQVTYIVDHIKQKYPAYKIIISTDNRCESYNSSIKVLCAEKGVISLIAATTIEEYIVLVSQSALVVGCDSGTIHLAASAGVQSVCLKGWWDYPFFLPYKWDENSADDKNPIVLYPRQKPECAFCGPLGKERAYLCEARVSKGLSRLCNFNIEKQDVLDSIDSVLN